MTYNELNNDPDFRERVAKRKKKIEKIRSVYNPKFWEQLKTRMLQKPFPEERFEGLIATGSNKVATSTGKHWEDKDKHQTIKYTLYEDYLVGLFGIDWSYQYCKECKNITSKSATLINGIENLVESYDYTNGTPKPYVAKGDIFAHDMAEMSDDINTGLVGIDEVLNFTSESLIADWENKDARNQTK